MNRIPSDENVVILDYVSGTASKASINTNIEKKISDLERKISAIENILWENRENYSKSLDIVANRELDINQIVTETRHILDENRKLYSEAFNSVIKKEEQLEVMIGELKTLWKEQHEDIRKQILDTKKILAQNRAIYTDALADLRQVELENGKSLAKIKENTPIFLGPVSALNPLLKRRKDSDVI